VHTLLKHKKNYNVSYISTAIKWSIRNELRRRYKWYKSKNDDDQHESKYTTFDAREKAYSAILSINELEERDNPIQLEDFSSKPDELCELKDLSLALKKAIKVLSERERSLIESRFYNNKKIKDLAEEFNVSQSRISRIIQSSLNRLKKELSKQGIS
jgi:RNA polymerase sigma factor (sigma-70 family)